jgi:hypothetical protein
MKKIRNKILRTKHFALSTNCQLALCLMLSALCFSCDKGDQFDCVKSTGKIIREERVVPFYKTIYLEDNIQLVLTNDTTGKITIEAGDNLVKKIKTSVNGGVLHITNENKCNWVRSYKKLITAYIGIKNLEDIFHIGHGDISSEGILTKKRIIIHHYSSGDIRLNLNSEWLWLDMDRLGNFTLEGQSDTLIAFTYGLGQLKSEHLLTHVCYLIHQGPADAYVYSDNILGVDIKNKGNIFYYGNPGTVDITKTGTGNLIKGD